MFRLAYPWMLLGLIFPLFLYWRRKKLEKRLNFAFPLTQKIYSLKGSWDSFFYRLPFLFMLGAMVFAVLGASRPQWNYKETVVDSEGIDIMLAIDASGSMAAMDFRLGNDAVNRLSVVKKVVKEFIEKQRGDRVGMVIFGDAAFTQSPLTLDHDVLIQLLNHVEVGIAGEGTAIGDGLALSVKRLKDSPGKSKVVILLTDGRNNAGKISPEKAAELAKSLGIKVYTIGIGTQGPVPFPQKGMFGVRLVYVDLDMDLETLEKIASITGGRYFYAADTKKLSDIYEEIGKLEKTKIEVKNYEIFEELYYYPTALALLLLMTSNFLSSTWLRGLA